MTERELVTKVLGDMGFRLTTEKPKYKKSNSDCYTDGKGTYIFFFIGEKPDPYPIAVWEEDTNWTIQPCDWQRLNQYLHCECNRESRKRGV